MDDKIAEKLTELEEKPKPTLTEVVGKLIESMEVALSYGVTHPTIYLHGLSMYDAATLVRDRNFGIDTQTGDTVLVRHTPTGLTSTGLTFFVKGDK